MKAYKFRIYPTKAQEKEMNSHLWLSKELWNEMLEFTKESYNNYQKFPTKKSLRAFVKKTGLFSQVGQELVDRLLDALHKKIEMKRKGEKGGFPRFKNFYRMKSLVYPQAGFSLDKKLKVTPFGEINIKKHREIEGKIKTLTLKREPSGKWFACFCAEQEKKQLKINNGKEIGVDLGLKDFAILSDGTKTPNPKHFKKWGAKLAFLQRRKERKKKGSKNRKKANLKIVMLHEKIADCRRDFLHKLSTRFVNTYSLIALEKLQSQEMAEQDFGKQINDAGWGMFANMLCYKAEEAGSKIVFVNPKNTTKKCSKCGKIVKKTLWDRIHKCSCGLEIDRDHNAAINILALAKDTLGHSGINACEDETKVSSMKQEAHAL